MKLGGGWGHKLSVHNRLCEGKVVFPSQTRGIPSTETLSLCDLKTPWSCGAHPLSLCPRTQYVGEALAYGPGRRGDLLAVTLLHPCKQHRQAVLDGKP